MHSVLNWKYTKFHEFSWKFINIRKYHATIFSPPAKTHDWIQNIHKHEMRFRTSLHQVRNAAPDKKKTNQCNGLCFTISDVWMTNQFIDWSLASTDVHLIQARTNFSGLEYQRKCLYLHYFYFHYIGNCALSKRYAHLIDCLLTYISQCKHLNHTRYHINWCHKWGRQLLIGCHENIAK